jgi:tetratricopeptide (TPR) repeat protein
MAVEEDIQAIRKESIEAHNLIIKASNQLANLSGEIRQIQKRQESYERKYWINSVWSYVIFTALIFGGVYLAFEAKVGAANREKAELDRQLAKARGDAEELQAKLAVRAQQEKLAEDILRLKRDNQDEEALKLAESQDPNSLSPVLGRLVSREAEDLKEKIGRQALTAGGEWLQRGQLKHAQREFDRALAARPTRPELLAELHGQRGQVLVKLNRTALAAADFLAAFEANPRGEGADNHLFSAAGLLETSGDVPRALEAYRRLLAELPHSRYGAQARRRLAALERSGAPVRPAPAAPEPTPAAPEPAPAAPEPAPAAPAGG